MSGKESVSLKVMLVEDDEGFRRSLAGLLTLRFPSIVIGEAGDGAEALQKVKSFSPQLILMDIKLPGAERPGGDKKDQSALSGHPGRYAHKLFED